MQLDPLPWRELGTGSEFSGQGETCTLGGVCRYDQPPRSVPVIPLPSSPPPLNPCHWLIAVQLADIMRACSGISGSSYHQLARICNILADHFGVPYVR